jgi:hypothetical protein
MRVRTMVRASACLPCSSWYYAASQTGAPSLKVGNAPHRTVFCVPATPLRMSLGRMRVGVVWRAKRAQSPRARQRPKRAACEL